MSGIIDLCSAYRSIPLGPGRHDVETSIAVKAKVGRVRKLMSRKEYTEKWDRE